MFFGCWAVSAPQQLAFSYGTASVPLQSNCSRTVSKRPGPTITPSSKPTKSHRSIEFYVQQKCHCSPRSLERIVLNSNLGTTDVPAMPFPPVTFAGNTRCAVRIRTIGQPGGGIEPKGQKPYPETRRSDPRVRLGVGGHCWRRQKHP